MSKREDDRGSEGEVPGMKDTNTGGVTDRIGGKRMRGDEKGLAGKRRKKEGREQGEKVHNQKAE